MDKGVQVIVSVTTRLGIESIQNKKGVHIYQGRLTQNNLDSLFEREKPDGIIDASNPFATDSSENVLKVARKHGIPYLYYERRQIEVQGKDIIRVKTHEEAVKELLNWDGNIVLTIGSNMIEQFTNIPNYQKRIFLRVIPDGKIISRCERLGFKAGNIIAIKGPFTEELNKHLLKYCNASIMVTKESGNTGGTIEKINAARTLNIPIIMIERGKFICENKANNLEEVMKYIEEIKRSCAV